MQIDSAPVLPVSDSHALAVHAGARVCGVVLNGIDLSRQRYGYGSYQKKA